MNAVLLWKRVEKIRAAHFESASKYQNFLIYGDFGTGKTSIALTCPTPVHIDSFDPGGTKLPDLLKMQAAGDLVVDSRWEKDSWKHPTVFRAWEKEMAERKREGYFDLFGTYILDSLTSWAASMMYEILRRGGKEGTRAGETPQIKDYMVQKLTAIDWVGELMSLPCHVVLTGHIGLDRDEVTGKMETGLLLASKLSKELPNALDEKYVSLVEKGGTHVLLTKSDGYYRAETRMGGKVFSQKEPPNIKALLKKAGRDFSDKPSLLAALSEKGE